MKMGAFLFFAFISGILLYRPMRWSIFDNSVNTDLSNIYNH